MEFDYRNCRCIFQTLQGQDRNHESDKQGTGVSQIENGWMVVKGEKSSNGLQLKQNGHGQEEIWNWKKEIGHNPHCY